MHIHQLQLVLEACPLGADLETATNVLGHVVASNVPCASLPSMLLPVQILHHGAANG